MIKEPLFLTIGPSTVKREEIAPIPPVTLNCLLFPSFMFTSRTEESLPPKLAGIPPFVSVTLFTASELNTEKKPKRCAAL